MEFEQVFKAAEDGALDELKNILNNKSKAKVMALVSAFTNGEIPLAAASRNGHLDVVKYLLEECHGDVEHDCEIESNAARLRWSDAAKGNSNTLDLFFKYQILGNGITKLDYSLLIACIYGNLKVAEYLIGQGANIDLPDTGDTCLIITCLNGHYEISKYLLECGADVNIKNASGDTPLYAGVRSSNLEVIKLLLQQGAVMNTDRNGWTPLLYAALRSYNTIVEYFIKEYNCTTQEKVNALELLGPTFMDQNEDLVAAHKFWKLAMELLYEDSELTLGKSTYISPISSYVHATEVRSCEQLDGLSDDEMKIQALLFRERILGPPGFSTSLYFIRNRAWMYIEDGDFQPCIGLWRYAFDAEADPGRKLCYYTLFSFIGVFHKAIIEWQDTAVCTVRRILTALNMRFDLENGNLISDIHDVLIIVIYVVNLICKLQPNLNDSEVKSMEKTVYELVRLNPKGKNGFALLHIASCSDSLLMISESVTWLSEFLPELSFPSPKAVHFLLKVGACPNALDSSKNTPLHVAAMNRPFDQNVFQSLLNEGAHLDFNNNENQTPLQLVPHANLLDIYPLQHLNLQCLCAQAILKHKIAYKDLLHKNLCEFVDSHSSY